MAQARLSPIEQDIMRIVGGRFTPDHIGPARYQQIVQRVQASPAQYLQAFNQRFLRPGVDPLTLADLYLPRFLEIVTRVAPQQVQALATRLASLYSGAVPAGQREDWEAVDQNGQPDELTRKRRRLDQHAATLGALINRHP